jgi:hypothetical protein
LYLENDNIWKRGDLISLKDVIMFEKGGEILIKVSLLHVI